MLGGLYGLDRKQKSFMVLVQAAPTLTAFTGLNIFKDALTSLILTQILAYILIPYFYIKYISKEGELQPYFLNEFREKKKQIEQGTSLFMSGFLLVCLGYLFIYNFRTSIIVLLQVPISYNLAYLFVFTFIMGIVNPILEEWYWRLFLGKTYQDNGVNSWVVNANYALFHFITLCTMIKWQATIGLTSTFFSMGKSFEYTMKKYGLVTTVLTHLGVSIAASLALLDILYIKAHNQVPVIE